MKKAKICEAIFMAVVLVFSFAGCKNSDSDKSIKFKSYAQDCTTGAYSKDLFYRNDFSIHAADPSIIKITDKASADYGWYYMYVTTEEIGTVGFFSYKSKDLVSWESNGLAYKPRSDSWGTARLWGPDVTYIDGTYYLYYCADDKTSENVHLPQGWADRNIGVATSKNPTGPFAQWTGTTADGDAMTVKTPLLNTSKFARTPAVNLHNAQVMDTNLFVDDDGELYLYFIRDAEPNISTPSIWGVKMKNPFTPDYSSAMQIARDGFSKVNGGTELSDEGMINEAPNMIKHNGKYYMTMSVNYIGNKQYSVKQAIGASPLDPNFEKVAAGKGGTLLTSMEFNDDGSSNLGAAYDFMSGTGSNCYIDVGGELFLAYQSHVARTPGGQRGIAIDRVQFVDNGNGQEVIYVNGPSYSLQPLAAEYSGYTNIIKDAEITATSVKPNLGTQYLSDGIYKNHNYSFIKEFETSGSTQITIEFGSIKKVRALLIYNSFDFGKWFSVIDEITFDGASIKDIKFDVESYYNKSAKIARPGGAAIVELDEEITAKKITIKIDSGKPIAISDIVILGR